MKGKRQKLKSGDSGDPKIPCFLRLPPGLHTWLTEEVATGRYGNIQDKIVDVLRDAHEAKLREEAAA